MASPRHGLSGASDRVVRQTQSDLESDQVGDQLDGQVRLVLTVHDDADVVFELGEPTDERESAHSCRYGRFGWVDEAVRWEEDCEGGGVL